MKFNCLILSAVLMASPWRMSALAAEISLPAPTDLAAAPVPDSPGGARLPVLEGKAATDAPVIAVGTETTFADETLCLNGSSLDGITLKLWSENGLTGLSPLRSAPDRLQVVLPKELPPSTLLLWPQKDGKTGAPFRVNGASVWWTWPHRAQPGKDRAVRLFGRNLTLPGREPQCVIEAGGQKQRLKVLRHDAYHIS